MINKKKNQSGFTLIELLVVLGILAFLLAITLVAINPAKQLEKSAETERKSEVNQILNAINQFQADNNGGLPSGITSTVTEIKTGGADICSQIVTEYIAAIPKDGGQPGDAVSDCSVAYTTGYTVVSGTNNRVTVASMSDSTISATR